MAGPNVRDRSRSPRFPSYSLSDSVAFAARIYKGVHRSSIDAESAFQLMGFKSRSGASSSALGAVRQFGLIEGISEKTRISDLALQILEPESEAERTSALRSAAVQPGVFKTLLERYNGRIPTVDEPIRSFLIRELGFSKAGAEVCLSTFRKTLDFVGDFSIEVSSGPANEENEIEAKSTETDVPLPQPSGQPSRSYRVPLSRGCEAQLTFYGQVNDGAISRLIKYLDLMREGLGDDSSE